MITFIFQVLERIKLVKLWVIKKELGHSFILVLVIVAVLNIIEINNNIFCLLALLLLLRAVIHTLRLIDSPPGLLISAVLLLNKLDHYGLLPYQVVIPAEKAIEILLLHDHGLQLVELGDAGTRLMLGLLDGVAHLFQDQLLHLVVPRVRQG